MKKRRPYNPFEGLEDFESLETLVQHIQNSLKVDVVKIPLPLNFSRKKITDPETILPVHELLVGDATFNYIRHRAEYVLTNVKVRIKKMNDDQSYSYIDKLKKYYDIRRSLLFENRQFNNGNLIRYMTAYKWKIVITREIKEKMETKEMDYPTTKLDLKNQDWNLLENTFAIRRHLVEEIIYYIDVEIEKLNLELRTAKYTWKGDDWRYELYELILALLASGKITIEKGDEKSFAHNFMILFGKDDERFPYYRGKIMDRKKRPEFLIRLQEALQNYNKPRSKKEYN